MKKILIVEDDASLGASLKQQLEQCGYVASWAANKSAAQELLKREKFALAVLDVGLPDGSGLDLAREISLERSCQILLITALNSAENRLEALELGAAEFIPKPFFLREFMLRIERILGAAGSFTIVRVGNATLDFVANKISFEQGEVAFPTQRELRVLKSLLEQAPKAVTRAELLRQAGGTEDSSGRSIDNAVSKLRQILQRSGIDPIRAVRGVGYQWIADRMPTKFA